MVSASQSFDSSGSVCQQHVTIHGGGQSFTASWLHSIQLAALSWRARSSGEIYSVLFCMLSLLQSSADRRCHAHSLSSMPITQYWHPLLHVQPQPGSSARSPYFLDTTLVLMACTLLQR